MRARGVHAERERHTRADGTFDEGGLNSIGTIGRLENDDHDEDDGDD